MKKILSVILAISMTLSILAFLPVNAETAANADNNLTQIDFDYELENGYTYGKVEDDQAAYPAFVSDDGNSVYALYLTRPMNEAPHRTYPLRDSKGNNKPIALEYGKDYKITLDYKNVSTSQNYIIGVYWCESLEAAKNGAASFDNNAWIYDEITSVAGSTAVSGWKTASQIITPPNETNVYPAIVAFGDNLKNKTEKIYFDNIKVENYEYKTLNTIDFDYEAAGNYNPKYYYKETNTGCISTDTFKKIGENSVYGVYLTRKIGSGGHRLYALRDTETNEPLALKYGKEYTFSFSYNCVKTPVALKAAIFWVRDPSKASNSDLISDCVQDVVAITTTGNTWKTALGTISPTKKGYMYPVFAVYNDYGIYGNAGDKVELYLDDMTINKTSDKTYNNIDFDYEVAGNYSSDYYKSDVLLKNLNDGVHNSVYGINILLDGNYSHRVIALRDSSANIPLALEYGKEYRISLAYKAKANISFSIGIYWSNTPFVSDGINMVSTSTTDCVQPLGAVNAGVGDWTTLTGVITPYSQSKKYPILIAYCGLNGNYVSRNNEIYFDDIIIQTTVTAEGKVDRPVNITFDEASQADFYAGVKTELNHNASIVTVDDTHNNAILFNRIVSSTDEQFGSQSGRNIGVSTSSAAGYASFTAGSQLCVSVDVNVAKYAEDLGENFYIGVIFDNPKAASRAGGNLYTASTSGKLLDIGRVSTKSANWQNITGNITVPEISESDVMWIVAYQKYYISSAYQAANTVYIDNIAIGNADINLDGNVDILDLINMKKKFAKLCSYNYKNDMNADGAFDSNDLVKCRKMLLNR